MKKEKTINSITVYDSKSKQLMLHVFKDGDKLMATITGDLDVEILDENMNVILETKGGK